MDGSSSKQAIGATQHRRFIELSLRLERIPLQLKPECAPRFLGERILFRETFLKMLRPNDFRGCRGQYTQAKEKKRRPPAMMVNCCAARLGRVRWPGAAPTKKNSRPVWIVASGKPCSKVARDRGGRRDPL